MTNMICISCPKGCQLQVDDKLQVSGNGCPNGVKYAINEITNPTRVLTTTIKIENGLYNRLPVVSNKPLPKDKIIPAILKLREISVCSPVKCQQVVYANILGLGIDIIASCDM
ncbi:MAG: DUF1667 domain-containing protein [Erysipelotrichaceae bacterium]